jgi:DNA-binding beta-propeller fold protein YncE
MKYPPARSAEFSRKNAKPAPRHADGQDTVTEGNAHSVLDLENMAAIDTFYFHLLTIHAPARELHMTMRRVLSVVVVFLFLCGTCYSQWLNGQSSDLVLGQPDFSTDTRGAGMSSMNTPVGLAIDPGTGKLFIADFSNHRVLRWPSVTSLTTGMPAEAVLGQSDFDSTSAATGPDRMRYPTAIVVDSDGRLWVADARNNRVLRFDNASMLPTGAAADGVLGQPDFTSNDAALSRNGMDYARGLAIDANGRLWVSDQSNRRVLRFDNAAAKPNGADADGVLGQQDYVSKSDSLLPGGFANPRGLALDADGNLYVASSAHNRVLRFDRAASKTDGAPADGVLGQPDLMTAGAATSRVGMKEPSGVAMDAAGRLYVADYGNNRVLHFRNAATLQNGAQADGVLGQPDFDSNAPSAGAAGMIRPWGLVLENERGKLWVSDVSNHRVLRFSAEGPLLSVRTQATKAIQPKLSLPYPNPMQDHTFIEFSLPHPANVTIAVFNMLGVKIHTITDAYMREGVHRLEWVNRSLPGGMYMMTLRSGNMTAGRLLGILR